MIYRKHIQKKEAAFYRRMKSTFLFFGRMELFSTNKKYAAGALLYAVFVSFLLFLICSFLIMANGYNSYIIDSAIARDRIGTNVLSAITLALGNPGNVPDKSEISIDLFGEGSDVVTLQKTPWAAYRVLKGKASWKNFSSSKMAMLGTDFFSEEQPAVYVCDHNNYISLCGRTRISGLCYLPQLGVKRGYVDGTGFSGTKLIDGPVRKSSNKLPDLNPAFLDNCLLCFSCKDSVRYWQEYTQDDSIINSFANKTLVLLLDKEDRIDYKYISGNIIVQSEIPIEIAENAHIEGAIVCAPGIVVKSGFKGSLQLISSDSILIENHCQLNYPSFAGVFNRNPQCQRTFLQIESHSEVYGGAVLISDSRQEYAQERLIIDDQSTIYGQVFCNQDIQLTGNVFGSVYCRNFYLKTRSSVYEDHLLNAVVDIEKLSKYYCGIPLISTGQREQIIQWLN